MWWTMKHNNSGNKQPSTTMFDAVGDEVITKFGHYNDQQFTEYKCGFIAGRKVDPIIPRTDWGLLGFYDAKAIKHFEKGVAHV